MKERIRRRGRLSELTLVSVDVNRLKYTNDTFGHQAGDLLLTSAVACMQSAFHDAEAICRTGGDEFYILSFARPTQVQKEIQALIASAAAVKLENIPSISLSIGVASHAEHPAMSIEELEHAADAAMYESKEDFYEKNNTGRGRA